MRQHTLKHLSQRQVALAALSACAACGLAHSQTPPDAGQVMRETGRPPMDAPASVGGVSPSDTAASKAPQDEGQRFAVTSIRFTGNTVFSEAALLALVAGLPGPARSLADVQQAANQISDHYRKAGYLVARAYLPQQRLEGGVLTIAVLEGRLGDVQLDNASRLSDERVTAVLAGLPRGSLAQRSQMDRPVLLLGDTPGVAGVDARLAAGEALGETVLKLRLSPALLMSGRLEADNLGGLYTGRNRVGGTINFNSPWGRGERFSVRVLKSDGDLDVARLAAQMPVGASGLTVGAAWNQANYGLGDSFAVLDAGGRSRSTELWARYPIQRGASANLFAQLGLARRELRDEVRSTDTVTEKSADVASLSLNGDWRDDIGGAGQTLASLEWSSGRLKLDSPEAAAIDERAARTAGRYDKFTWSAERQQALPAGFSLSASARGQVAGSRNLDSSEKFSLGGAGGVRAYASGEAIGDDGWLASLELRYALMQGLLLSAFHDRGQVEINSRPYLDGSNTLRRSGSGLGLQGGHSALDWRLNVAWRGSEVGTAEPDKKPRVWLQLGWRF